MDSTWRRLLVSRFILVPLGLAVAVAAWNAYISLHDGGLVRGRVVGPDGAPVAGATVRMLEKNFTTNSDRGSARTLADGSFEFTDNRSHNVLLRAEKEGVGRSEQVVVRLYFRAQNVTLDRPMTLKKDAGKDG